MDGQLERQDGRWRLHFTRTLAQSPEAVWPALVESDQLAAWFPTDIQGERAAGAALRFVFRHGEGPALAGRLLVYDPPSTLVYQWGEEMLRFELRPEAAGSVLTFVNTFDELGKAARDAAGWHACLDRLGYHLDGATPPWGPGERWAQVHPSYVARFGPEAATIGPPGGG